VNSEGIEMQTFQGLQSLVKRLRSPGGCPWDQEQTHSSIRRNLLEETYEVLEAIDGGDPKALCEELGDILVQIAFHVQMAEEAGHFTMEDVLGGINGKLVKRHPHVFGDVKVGSAEEVEERWDAIKRSERGGKSSLDRVPRDLPALAYSQSVQDRAARTGFEWPSLEASLDKLAEEVGEVSRTETPEDREEEMGDVLFALVSTARQMGIHAEVALQGANRKFYERFISMETAAQGQGRSFADISQAEKLELWERSKGE